MRTTTIAFVCLIVFGHVSVGHADPVEDAYYVQVNVANSVGAFAGLDGDYQLVSSQSIGGQNTNTSGVYRYHGYLGGQAVDMTATSSSGTTGWSLRIDVMGAGAVSSWKSYTNNAGLAVPSGPLSTVVAGTATGTFVSQITDKGGYTKFQSGAYSSMIDLTTTNNRLKSIDDYLRYNVDSTPEYPTEPGHVVYPDTYTFTTPAYQRQYVDEPDKSAVYKWSGQQLAYSPPYTVPTLDDTALLWQMPMHMGPGIANPIEDAGMSFIAMTTNPKVFFAGGGWQGALWNALDGIRQKMRVLFTLLLFLRGVRTIASKLTRV